MRFVRKINVAREVTRKQPSSSLWCISRAEIYENVVLPTSPRESIQWIAPDLNTFLYQYHESKVSFLVRRNIALTDKNTSRSLLSRNHMMVISTLDRMLLIKSELYD